MKPILLLLPLLLTSCAQSDRLELKLAAVSGDGSTAPSIRFLVTNRTSRALSYTEGLLYFPRSMSGDFQLVFTDSAGGSAEHCSNIDFQDVGDRRSLAPQETVSFEEPVAFVSHSYCLRPGKPYSLRVRHVAKDENGKHTIDSNSIDFVAPSVREGS